MARLLKNKESKTSLEGRATWPSFPSTHGVLSVLGYPPFRGRTVSRDCRTETVTGQDRHQTCGCGRPGKCGLSIIYSIKKKKSRVPHEVLIAPSANDSIVHTDIRSHRFPETIPASPRSRSQLLHVVCCRAVRSFPPSLRLVRPTSFRMGMEGLSTVIL